MFPPCSGMEHCPALPDVQYLKTIVVCILSVSVVVSYGRVTVTTSWPKEEVSLPHNLIEFLITLQ